MKIVEFVNALGSLYSVDTKENHLEKFFFPKKIGREITPELKSWEDFINIYDVSTILFFGFQFLNDPYIIELETGQELYLIAGGGPTFIAGYSIIESQLYEFDMETMQIIGPVCESYDCLFNTILVCYEYMSRLLKGGYTSMENPFKEEYFKKIVKAAGGAQYSGFFRSMF